MGDFVLRRFPGHDGCSAGKKTTEGGRILASEKKKESRKKKSYELCVGVVYGGFLVRFACWFRDADLTLVD